MVSAGIGSSKRTLTLLAVIILGKEIFGSSPPIYQHGGGGGLIFLFSPFAHFGTIDKKILFPMLALYIKIYKLPLSPFS
jgi:hypothetical protein